MATILIVDDEKPVRDFLTFLLKTLGHRLLEAGDGYQALSLFHSERPDLVIVDIVMPAMDGFEFIRQVRSLRSGKSTGLIIHTAVFLDEKARALADACGVQFFLEKPSSPRAILQAVENCLKTTTAFSGQTFLAEDFDREHLGLLNNALVEKVRALEAANRRLEQEVGERKRSERELRESHTLLHAVVENIPDAVYAKDRHGRYILLNSGGARIAGKVVEDILGRDDTELFAPETARRFREIDRQVMDSGKSQTYEAGPRLEESIGLIDRAVQQVRDLSLDLRPSILDDFGLEAALRWYVNRLGERTGLAVHFDSESSLVELPYAVRNACFRVTQEALTNVVRHAHAKEVWLTFHGQEEEVRLEIRDDGVGFDVAESLKLATRGGSLGLLGMRERIELLGGRVDVESQHGTTVRVRVPLEN